MSGPEDFFARWSRRKREVAEPAPRTPASEPAPAPAPEAAAEPGGLTADEIAALPPVEELTPESDITAFLRAGVPAVLRNAALRRMWSLDPAIGGFENAAREYAYDWNVPGGAPGFGPLEPGDDVPALLRRVFGEDDGAAEPSAAEPLRPDTRRDESSQAAGGADAPAGPIVEPAPVEGDALSPVGTPALAEVAAAPIETVTHEPRSVAVRAPAEDAPRPKPLRAHGGARPA